MRTTGTISTKLQKASLGEGYSLNQRNNIIIALIKCVINLNCFLRSPMWPMGLMCGCVVIFYTIVIVTRNSAIVVRLRST